MLIVRDVEGGQVYRLSGSAEVIIRRLIQHHQLLDQHDKLHLEIDCAGQRVKAKLEIPLSRPSSTSS